MICYYCGQSVEVKKYNIITQDKHYIAFINCKNCNTQYFKESYLDSKHFCIYEIKDKFDDKSK